MPVEKRELYEGRKVFARIPILNNHTKWKVVHTTEGFIRLEETADSSGHAWWYIWDGCHGDWNRDNADIKEFYFLDTDPMAPNYYHDDYNPSRHTRTQKITAPKYKIGDVIVWKKEGDTTHRQMLISRAWTEGNEWKYADNGSSCTEHDVIEYGKEEVPCEHKRKSVTMAYGKYNPTEYSWTCKDCGENKVEEM